MPPQSVYLLVGNEEFLKEEWISAARQKLFKDEPPGAASMDFSQFRAGGDCNFAAVFDTAKTSPFLAKKRLLVLRDIDSLLGLESAREQLLNYVKTPAAHTILVLDTDIKEKGFPPNNFYKQLGSLASVKTFKKIYDRDLVAWIIRRFALRSKKAEPAAAELLKQLKGNDLRLLDQEIEKLCVHAGKTAPVSKEDVQLLVGNDVLSRVDDLVYAISRNDKRKMTEASFDFQNLDKREFGQATGLFCWQLRRILRAREMMKEGRSSNKIASELKIWDRDMEKFLFQCRKLKSSWLKKGIREIAEFDLRIKRGGQSDVFLDWQALLLRLFALASL